MPSSTSFLIAFKIAVLPTDGHEEITSLATNLPILFDTNAFTIS